MPIGLDKRDRHTELQDPPILWAEAQLCGATLGEFLPNRDC